MKILMQIPKEKRQEIFKLSAFWLYETLAFILLPLVIYLLLYLSFKNSIYDFSRLPEWMFITIVLYGDTIRKLILLYLKFKNPELRIGRTVAQAVIAIVISSTFLVIILIAQQEKLEISPFIYWGQFVIFIHSVWFSYSTNIRNSLVNNEGEKITKLVLFNHNKEKA